jgi:rfaE bifunctional protein nucleotidyltransferase chain/domain
MGEIIRDHDHLASLVFKLQSRGKRVVVTNGCFDLLHVGHVRCLQGAKAEGDVLIVAVNSDASFKACKQGREPITCEEERLEILSALGAVDYVTCFSEPSADKLLLRLKPDVHAKGTDYTEDTVPERETVLSYGGKIAIVGDPKTHSSSKIGDLLR